MSRTERICREPEQLDLLDWIAAQEARATPALPQSDKLPPTPSLADARGELAPVLLTRVDPACNMRRFYDLALARSLWGEWGVMRQWGRIGTQGQKRTDWHASPEEAAAELEQMAEGKRRRGYR